jgi:FixJ family two-component response regulator
VLDVRIPGTSGLDLLEQLPQRKIGIPVIVLTGYGDVPMAVRALKGGAVDFIEKPFNDQTLVDSVHKAIRRDGQMRRQRSERMESALRVTRLTPRERQVMDLVVVGKANKQVAGELGCSCKTVEVHRARVMEKMQADSVAALVRMALLL